MAGQASDHLNSDRLLAAMILHAGAVSEPLIVLFRSDCDLPPKTSVVLSGSARSFLHA